MPYNATEVLPGVWSHWSTFTLSQHDKSLYIPRKATLMRLESTSAMTDSMAAIWNLGIDHTQVGSTVGHWDGRSATTEVAWGDGRQAGSFIYATAQRVSRCRRLKFSILGYHQLLSIWQIITAQVHVSQSICPSTQIVVLWLIHISHLPCHGVFHDAWSSYATVQNTNQWQGDLTNSWWVHSHRGKRHCQVIVQMTWEDGPASHDFFNIHLEGICWTYDFSPLTTIPVSVYTQGRVQSYSLHMISIAPKW